MRQLGSVADGPSSGIRVSRQSPTVELIRRFVLEKTGSFQLALREWDLAAASFTAAVQAAESQRGLLKSRAGLALANYSRGLDRDDPDSCEVALDETRSIADEAQACGERDLAQTAQHNVGAMARRGTDLQLYEIL